MNAVGLAEQESGRAVGFFCNKCGRAQVPMFCQQPVTVELLTELHRKAQACCSTSVCEKHGFTSYDWHLCPHCVQEGPRPIPVQESTAELIRKHTKEVIDDQLRVRVEVVPPKAKRSRKAAAK